MNRLIPSPEDIKWWQPQFWSWLQQTTWVYNCHHGHVPASLAHQMFCVLTNSNHLVIMVATSSLIETFDSERLRSSFHLNFSCYGSIWSADVLFPSQQWPYAIMVTANSLIDTADSQWLRSSAHLNVAWYGSIRSADVLCPNQQWSSCDHGYSKQPDWYCWQPTIAIICWSTCCMLWQHWLSRSSVC